MEGGRGERDGEERGEKADSLEETEDEGVEPHAVAAELRVLAHFREQAV